jgi:hypothetical protein
MHENDAQSRVCDLMAHCGQHAEALVFVLQVAVWENSTGQASSPPSLQLCCVCPPNIAPCPENSTAQKGSWQAAAVVLDWIDVSGRIRL